MTSTALSLRQDNVAPPCVIDKGDLQQTLASIVGTHDFTAGLYAHLGHGFNMGQLCTRAGGAWLITTRNFDRSSFLKHIDLARDPLAMLAAESLTPFEWTLGDFTDHPRLTRLMDQWGMRSGTVVPVQDYALGPAFLNLFGPSPRPGERLAAGQTDHAALMLAAAKFHTAAGAQRAGRRTFGLLTAREVAVLRLAAIGRTEQETADALALSRRSIQYYLASAVEKLGAPNKPAAVARAVGAGVIRVSNDHAWPGRDDLLR